MGSGEGASGKLVETNTKLELEQLQAESNTFSRHVVGNGVQRRWVLPLISQGLCRTAGQN